jgi:hypothetical protein
VQGYDRYAYVNNNPVKYNDPNGHDPAGSSCYDRGYCNETTDTWANATPYMPSGLDDGGQAAWNGLQNLGLLGDTQEAMEFVVGTEFGESIDTPEAVWPLTKAMTRLYYSYCSPGAWTASCLNNFWGYMQGTLEAANDPSLPLSKMSHNANVPLMAGAILGNSMGLEKWGFAPELYSGGCDNPEAQVLCGWAVINSTANNNYYNNIKPPHGKGELSPYRSESTLFRDVLIVDDGKLLVVLSPYQQTQDYFKFGNGDFDYNITHFK